MTDSTEEAKLAILKEVEQGMAKLIEQAKHLRETAPDDDEALRAEYIALADGFEKAAEELRESVRQLRLTMAPGAEG